jgi:hypothetical protein
MGKNGESFFLKKNGSVKMPGTKLNAHGGFIPAAVAPPECDNLWTGNYIIIVDCAQRQ